MEERTDTERAGDNDTSAADSIFSQPEKGRDALFLFSNPLESDTLIVNSPYGYRKDPITGKRKFHSGVDLRASGDNVYAIMPGKIDAIGYDRKLGNFVRIEYGGLVITYGHLLMTVGSKGEYVFAGQSVGITGSTGRSTGEHLHVAAKFKGKAVDPMPILQYVNNYVRKARDDRAQYSIADIIVDKTK